jgi:nucleotide-binding universal stress UspA family protein
MLNKIKKILVAIDFSQKSDLAFAEAINLAKTNNAEITLLHVMERKKEDELVDRILSKILPESLWLSTKEYYSSLLQAKIEVATKQKIKINQVVFNNGNPAKRIIQYTKKHKFDLLVIGAHGKYSLRDTFIGTTAEYLVEKTKCPVLIIKIRGKNDYKNILLPVDFSNASKKAVQFGQALFPRASFELYHVGGHEYVDLVNKDLSHSKRSELKKAIFSYLDNEMKKFLKLMKRKKTSYHFDFGYPSLSIIKEAKKNNVDLLIMGTQGHGKKHYLEIGSVARAVLHEVNKNILFIPK